MIGHNIERSRYLPLCPFYTSFEGNAWTSYDHRREIAPGRSVILGDGRVHETKRLETYAPECAHG